MRGAGALVFLLALTPFQALRLRLDPRGLPGRLPRIIHGGLLRILGIRIEVVGMPCKDGRVTWISNHLSYLDVPVLGSLCEVRFVAKDEVAGWPVFGWLANLQRTIYISRRPRHAAIAAATFARALDQGGVVVLFPEGTSSAGSAVLPFRPSLLEPLMAGDRQATKVQALTLRLLQVDGRPADETVIRDLYAYHGDMQLLRHLRTFLRLRGALLQVVFHPPLWAGEHAHRRALAECLHAQVTAGLVTGRPAP